MSIVEDLITELATVCAGLPDPRTGPRRDGDYTMADIGLSAFSLFFMGSPSFLAHQRRLERGQGRSNCQTLFGMSAIPSDNYVRLMLDGAAPAAFDGLFMRAIAAAGPLTRFHRLDGRVLVALGMPTTTILDRNGKVVRGFDGPLLREVVEALGGAS